MLLYHRAMFITIKRSLRANAAASPCASFRPGLLNNYFSTKNPRAFARGSEMLFCR